jgi:hypothetical protein
MAHAENSQYMKVSRYMQTHPFITPMDAIRRYNVTRLSAIIFDMKKDGINIKTNIVRKKNEDGRITPYAEYSLN